MITVWILLDKAWEYDDSFYDFRGNRGVRSVCLSLAQATREVDRATAQFVRDHYDSLELYARHPWERGPYHVPVADVEALTLAREIGLESPVTVLEIVVTAEFLQAAGLSAGQRTRILRTLGTQLRNVAPRAADHLESHEE